MTDPSSNEKQLEATSFVIHATRGVVRDQSTRRKMMMWLLAAAVALLLCGITFFRPALDPHSHPWRVIGFWLVCVWLTLTALLLAVFDLLTVRSNARRAERALRESLKTSSARSTSGQ